MRLIFLGTPVFAVPSLRALHQAGHDIALVITRPDRPAGRGRRLTPPPVVRYAAEHALPLWQTDSLKGAEAEARVRSVGAEAMALAAFATIVPNNVLALAPHGILNVHPSLLPRWRGAAPIQSALLAGDPETGVSIIRLTPRMDAGPILLQERLAINPADDSLSLEARLADHGAHLLVRALGEVAAGTAAAREQDEARATYCARVQRENARIDWSQPAELLWRQVRAYRGWPRAFTTWEGKLLTVLRATPMAAQAAPPGGVGVTAAGVPLVATGADALRLDEVQLEGRRAQAGAEFLRGAPGVRGAILGQPRSHA